MKKAVATYKRTNLNQAKMRKQYCFFVCMPSMFACFKNNETGEDMSTSLDTVMTEEVCTLQFVILPIQFCN